MKRYFIYTAIALLFFGCDYNEKYFEGYDDYEIVDVVQFTGDYTGDYPSEGYFLDRTSLESSVDKMLKGIYQFCDKGSTAKVSVLFGDITPGIPSVDQSYELATEDYDAMGTENGQPGRYDNFDDKMDVDAYLQPFCADKYASLPEGSTVSITYKFYSGGTSNRTATYKKEASEWVSFELEVFVTDFSYTLAAEDYDAMGTENGRPGRNDNFDANMDVDHYLTIFLKMHFPYTPAESTCRLTYKYYAGGTSEQFRIYEYDGTRWNALNPYADTVEVLMKIAEMEFDGCEWKLMRLMGGTQKLVFTSREFALLVDWVKENKPHYMSNQNDLEEYYFGSSVRYNNINNAYNTWKSYYNVGGEYDGYSNDQLQEVMDRRLAEGIADVVLPAVFPVPDTGLTYAVTYYMYGGRGTGNYVMSFVYDQTAGAFVFTNGPVKE